MSTQLLDRDELRRLFDLRSSYNVHSGGDYAIDPYPVWRELRERAPVHEGTVHELTGYPGDAFFHGLPFPDRPHFSAFSYDACDSAYRDPDVFASSPDASGPVTGDISMTSSMLSMGGAQHRRYRSLVQPSFVPAKARWWIANWIERTVHLLIDGFADAGRAELNVDFAAAIPVLTITGSFGVPVEQALVIRQSLSRPMAIVEVLEPIVAERRRAPQDDLISVLVDAEYTDEDGVTHHLSDPEIYSFALLLMGAGSGTTWKQMGITLTALLQRPDVLRAVREDRELLRPAIEESLRWMPTDPMFGRFVAHDTELGGVAIPQGSVMHVCLAAANRDPSRWARADEFDPSRPPQPHIGFGDGSHICLGMHVARAEIATAIEALVRRLPNLRLDPDAPEPRVIGMYERGPTAVPVRFG